MPDKGSVAFMPDIRFLQMPEGPRIAYTVHGSGPPLICPAWCVSHVECDWQASAYARRLAEEQLAIATPKMAANLFEFAYSMDIREVAPDVLPNGSLCRSDEACRRGDYCAAPAPGERGLCVTRLDPGMRWESLLGKWVGARNASVVPE